MSEIKKGDGVTQQFIADRVPWTVIAVHSSTKLSIQRDKYTRIDNNGQSESQTYSIAADRRGEVAVISKRIDGLWRRVGDDLRAGYTFVVGHRRVYRCPSF